jgi:flagellar basal-body rod modification protein FlgD
MSTTPVVPTPPAGGTTSSTTNGLPSGQSLNNMFLQLLVAQLQNQDPTSPVDPSQFVGQLAQFSELSEVTSIYQLLQQVVPAGSGSSGGTSPATGNSASAGATPAVAASAPTQAAISSPAVSPAPLPFTNFSSPSLSALTRKIAGQ